MAAFMVGHSPVLVLVSGFEGSRHLVKSHRMLAYRTYLDLLAHFPSETYFITLQPEPSRATCELSLFFLIRSSL
jgi:hypothetical protein